MDFKEIITNTLENNGLLNKIRAELRGEIFENIKNEGFNLEESKKIPDEDLVTFRVFEDFLIKAKGKNTLKTYLKESNLQAREDIDKEVFAGLEIDFENEAPVIFEIIQKFTNKFNKT